MKSVTLRRPGCIRGIRLVSARSLFDYLARLAEEQGRAGFTIDQDRDGDEVAATANPEACSGVR